MLVAYRGYSVILFAPVAALGAVLLTMPGAVLPAYSALFMENMATFVRNYFPVFMLGALFGKLIEISGFARGARRRHQPRRRPPPRDARHRRHLRADGLRRRLGVRRRLRGLSVRRRAVSRGEHSQAPDSRRRCRWARSRSRWTRCRAARRFRTSSRRRSSGRRRWRRRSSGRSAACSSSVVGMAYLDWRRRAAASAGEGYGTGHLNEPERVDAHALVSPFLAFLPLAVVAATNIVLHGADPEVVRRDRDAGADAGGQAARDRGVAAGRRLGGRGGAGARHR